MDITIILLIIGLICIIASFFIGNSSSNYDDELEKVSISLHQETNGLKKRLKAVEEELMIGVGPLSSGGKTKTQSKPVHVIIVNQILSLHSQGFSISDIAMRSSLSNDDVIAVLQSKGVIA
ncbi:hypothetical protein FQ087_07380 [Sporosarcina sp. ANT_H38]|uniref:hypothetical protein n=1 Tax=Sporosarcina sp. ANT_H38 TaxID=2597358 RepID=UPI0011F2E76D|nr:hypothetical protein [Sporosarcina sp. ANT_H38]KAA0966064.1 hypothetical protein FQ087_07380 [Sporosarcina sp. ANT_H38]